ncbi:MAG: hypothetical protein OXT67_08045 [Zetaproteobacteria bacterium]|nr:hypothetical protein [Zetaproteobacteria bacterium]
MKNKLLVARTFQAVMAVSMFSTPLRAAQLDGDTQTVSLVPGAYGKLGLSRRFDNEKDTTSFRQNDVATFTLGSSFYDDALTTEMAVEGQREQGSGVIKQGSVKAKYKLGLFEQDFEYADLSAGLTGKMKRANPLVTETNGRTGAFVKLQSVQETSYGEIEFATGHEAGAVLTNSPERAVATVEVDPDVQQPELYLDRNDKGELKGANMGSYYEGYVGVAFKPYFMEGASVEARLYREAKGIPQMVLRQEGEQLVEQLNRYGLPRHNYKTSNYVALGANYKLNDRVTLVGESALFEKEATTDNRRIDSEVGLSISLL